MMKEHHTGGAMERADIAIFMFFAGLLTFVLGGIFLIPY